MRTTKQTKFIKGITLVMFSTILSSSILIPTVSYADSNNNDSVNKVSNIDDDPARNITYNSSELTNSKQTLKNKAQYSDSDLDEFTNNEIVYIARQLNSPKPQVGATTIAKAIVKVWKKIPKSIKKQIAKYTTLGGLIKAIDHYTGTEYHIIYSACRYVGMSKNVANIVTKTITLFI